MKTGDDEMAAAAGVHPLARVVGRKQTPDVVITVWEFPFPIPT
jgi:hypothetical protein